MAAVDALFVAWLDDPRNEDMINEAAELHGGTFYQVRDDLRNFFENEIMGNLGANT